MCICCPAIEALLLVPSSCLGMNLMIIVCLLCVLID